MAFEDPHWRELPQLRIAVVRLERSGHEFALDPEFCLPCTLRCEVRAVLAAPLTQHQPTKNSHQSRKSAYKCSLILNPSLAAHTLHF